MKKALVAIAFFVAGCAGEKPLYDWGDYSSTLLAKYKGNLSTSDYSERLRSNISRLEAKNAKVPPGLYAEYGFALLEAGNEKAALRQFAKERSSYPESVAFIDKIVGRLQAQKAQPAEPITPSTEQPPNVPENVPEGASVNPQAPEAVGREPTVHSSQAPLMF